MRYLVVASTVLLVGCSGVTSAQLTERAKEIQNYTRLACKFVPTIATIANILSGGAAAPAAVIANDICLAVTTAPLADGPNRGKHVVYGVVIQGKFVK